MRGWYNLNYLIILPMKVSHFTDYTCLFPLVLVWHKYVHSILVDHSSLFRALLSRSIVFLLIFRTQVVIICFKNVTKQINDIEFLRQPFHIKMHDSCNDWICIKIVSSKICLQLLGRFTKNSLLYLYTI